MAIRIGNNTATLAAQRYLGLARADRDQSSQRLSSGMRINKASDDAAGLAISSSLNAKARIYNRAVQNANDGLSALAICESAINQLSNIVTRISELAEQSANGTYSNVQRSSLDKEAQSLKNEFSRIVQVTEFNGIKLLNGTSGKISLQVGADGRDTSLISASQDYAVKRSTGDGSFATGVTCSTFFRAESVVTGDYNGDGNIDYVSSGNSSGGLSIRIGNGDGTFKAETSLSPFGKRGLVSADFDGDTKQDLVSYDTQTSNLIFYGGSGDGTFTNTKNIDTTLQAAVAALDINSDSIPDLITSSGSNIYTYLGKGDGTFAPKTTYAMGGAVSDVSTADINNDGTQDILAQVGVGNTIMLMNLGNGSFAPPATLITDDQTHIATGDVNADGNVDIVTSNVWGGPVSLALGNGDGSFKALTNVNSSFTGFLSLRDIDQNGSDDLVMMSNVSATTELWMALSKGDGTFNSVQITTAAGTLSREPAFADFNNDGAEDFVSVTYNTACNIFISHSTDRYDLRPFSLKTRAGALAALDAMKSRLDELSASVGQIGASQSRLLASAQTGMSARENFLNAASRIQDCDVAHEAANLIRTSILESSAAAILRQANQSPAIVRQLLAA